MQINATVYEHTGDSRSFTRVSTDSFIILSELTSQQYGMKTTAGDFE